MAKDVLHPEASLLMKLGSIVVHTQEMLSAKGHPFDKAALDALMADPEITTWLAAMDKLALIPKKR